jgi:vancomycin permeability regulator SanA
MADAGRVSWWQRWRRVATGLGSLLVVALILIGGPTVWVHAKASGRTYNLANVPKRPVAIVFGAGLAPNGAPSPFLSYRLDVAAHLYREGKVAVILVSGDNRTVDHDEPTAMRNYLVDLGVSEEKIVRDYAGRDTYDTCVRAREIFSVPSAVLVTQDYHLPRALAVCSAVGVPSVGVADTTATARFPNLVQEYSFREIGANIKAAWDIVIGRKPVLGAREDSVTDALESSGWSG